MRRDLLAHGLIGLFLMLFAITNWQYNPVDIEYWLSNIYFPWNAALWLVGIITILLIPVHYCVKASKIGLAPYLYPLVGIVVFIGVVIFYLLLDWILSTWNSTTLLILTLLAMAVGAGLAIVLFARKKPLFLTWLVGSIIVSYTILNWISSTWGASLLYYLVVAITVVGYIAVFASYALIPKEMMGGE